MNVRVVLDDYLATRGLSTNQLAKAAAGKAARGSIYALASGATTRVDLNTLGSVVEALEELTGERVRFDDLLERVEAGAAGVSRAGVPYTGDPETDEVLDAHPDILERIHKLEAGESKTRPLREVMTELGLEP